MFVYKETDSHFLQEMDIGGGAPLIIFLSETYIKNTQSYSVTEK